MHAVAKLYCQEELWDVGSWLIALTEPEYMEHCADVKRHLKGPAATAARYADWSNWGWLKSLASTFDVLRNSEKPAPSD